MGETFNRVALAVATGGASETTRYAAKGVQMAVDKGIEYIDDKSGAKAAREEQARIAQEALDAQNAQIEEVKSEKKAQKAEAASLAEQQLQRKAALKSQRGRMRSGRSGTILTSPLGSVGAGASTGARKTLLGG